MPRSGLKRSKRILPGPLVRTGLLLLAFVSIFLQQVDAQVVKEGALTGISFRFASSINHFYRAPNQPLVNGAWSTGVLGISYKKYERNGHVEIGAAIGYKGQNGGLPVVMHDFKNNQNVGQTYFQAELKAGPRVFWNFYPKFGLIAGYRTQQQGYFASDAKPYEIKPLAKFFMALPMGFTIDLPTSYGTTGFGFFYDLGLTNIVRGQGWSDGSHINSLTFEIHTTLRTK